VVPGSARDAVAGLPGDLPTLAAQPEERGGGQHTQAGGEEAEVGAGRRRVRRLDLSGHAGMV
jgi:hypothetical protein